MATGYSEVQIDAMWATLQHTVRQMDLGQPVDLYSAWDLICVLDTVECIWKRGEYSYCRARVTKKSHEQHIVRKF